jgi:uncharacterized protein YjbJ (UPF0337 family)
MNWDRVEGQWKQYTGKVREKWGKLTDSDLEVIKGKRDQLVARSRSAMASRKMRPSNRSMNSPPHWTTAPIRTLRQPIAELEPLDDK